MESQAIQISSNNDFTKANILSNKKKNSNESFDAIISSMIMPQNVCMEISNAEINIEGGSLQNAGLLESLNISESIKSDINELLEGITENVKDGKLNKEEVLSQLQEIYSLIENEVNSESKSLNNMKQARMVDLHKSAGIEISTIQTEGTSEVETILGNLKKSISKLEGKASETEHDLFKDNVLELMSKINGTKASGNDIKTSVANDINSLGKVSLNLETKENSFSKKLEENNGKALTNSKANDSIVGFADQVAIENHNLTTEKTELTGIRNIETVKDVLKDQIIDVKTGGKSTIELKLQPAELGKIQIKLEMSQGLISGKIFVENEMAKTALQQHMEQIISQISEQGLSVSKLDVDVSDQFNEGFNQFDENQNNNQGSNTRATEQNDYSSEKKARTILAQYNKIQGSTLNLLA